MRLTRQPQNLTVLVLAIPELDDVMKVLHQFQNSMDLTAFEFFSDKAMRKVLSHNELPEPFEGSAEFYALIEFEAIRSEEHTSELQSRPHLVCRLLLEKKKNNEDETSVVYD